MKNGYIYKLSLLIDTRLFKTGEIYIGKHNGNRNSYFSSGKYVKDICKKYGKDVFFKEILHEDIENLEELNRLEIHYISLYKCNRLRYGTGLNLTDGGDGAVPKKGKDNNKCRSIVQCDMEGNFLHLWECASYAGNCLNLNGNLLAKVARNKTYYSQGFLWADVLDYENGKVFYDDARCKSLRKTVFQFDLNGTFIKEWESCHAVARFYGKSQGSFSTVLASKSYFWIGYLWCYKEDFESGIRPTYSPRKDYGHKKVQKLDLFNKIICEYSSITEAALSNNLNKCTILRSLKGQIKSPRKYLWKYV